MDGRMLPTSILGIKTLSPVHIGSGEKITRLSYVLRGFTADVIDENRLMNWVLDDPQGKLAAEFPGWVESSSRSAPNSPKRTSSIGEFLKKHGKDPRELVSYSAEVQTRSNINEVLSFIKTRNSSWFWPGSSLKGSLRSALLRGILLANPELKERAAEMVAGQAINRKSAAERIEAEIFSPGNSQRSKASNFDLNRVLVIRDSSPQSSDQLQWFEVKIFSARENQLSPKHFSIFVEAVPSGSNFALPVSWQNHLLEKTPAKGLGFEQISRYMLYLPEFCRAASFEMLDQEIRFYQQLKHPLAGWFEEKRDELKGYPEEIFFLPIGWGSGYDAKTITDLLGKKTFEIVAENCGNTSGLGRPGNSPWSSWLGPELSPKSRKVVVYPDGHYEPIGWVLARFLTPKDTDPSEDWFSNARLMKLRERPSFEAVNVQSSNGHHHQKTGAPVETSVPAAANTKQNPPDPPKPDQKKTEIIRQFEKLPQVGDRFKGTVIEESDQDVMLEIPGLEDTEHYAVIWKKSLDKFKRIMLDKELLCKVIKLEKEEEQIWRVICEAE